MGLFSFLKRKREQTVDFTNEKDQGKIISQGIFFEDTNQFLKWGYPVKTLSDIAGAKQKLFADRTVYNWGEHSILDGLKLELVTVFWNHREESRYKLFNSIEFRVAGNEPADNYLKLITAHIEKHFGPATKKEITETEIVAEWLVNGTRLYLHFYEQHANKLHFEISKI